MKINFENINKYVREFKNEKELLEFVKDKIDFLYRNNKNYNQVQWVVIQDLQEIMNNVRSED